MPSPPNPQTIRTQPTSYLDLVPLSRGFAPLLANTPINTPRTALPFSAMPSIRTPHTKDAREQMFLIPLLYSITQAIVIVVHVSYSIITSFPVLESPNNRIRHVDNAQLMRTRVSSSDIQTKPKWKTGSKTGDTFTLKLKNNTSVV